MRGGNLFVEKQCSNCHSEILNTDRKRTFVETWMDLKDPSIWAERMWNQRHRNGFRHVESRGFAGRGYLSRTLSISSPSSALEQILSLRLLTSHRWAEAGTGTSGLSKLHVPHAILWGIASSPKWIYSRGKGHPLLRDTSLPCGTMLQK